jgi:ribosomal protein L37AE/L43A
MEKTLLRGSGGLAKCPHCGSTVLQPGHREFLNVDTMMEDMECRVCGRAFLLRWIAAGWEEVRP